MGLIVDARWQTAQAFSTLFDLARRVDLKRGAHGNAGALARLMCSTRPAQVFASLDALVGYSSAIHDQKNSNQVSLFGEAGDDLPEHVWRRDWLPPNVCPNSGPLVSTSLVTRLMITRRTESANAGQVTIGRKWRVVARWRAPSLGGRNVNQGQSVAFAQCPIHRQYSLMFSSGHAEAARDHLKPAAVNAFKSRRRWKRNSAEIIRRSVMLADMAVTNAGRQDCRCSWAAWRGSVMATSC
jgi:DNA polymerase-3 subunit alpha